MNTAIPTPEPPREPSPAEIELGLVALENLVAENAPKSATPAVPAVVEDQAAEPVVSGETKRVRKLRKEVAEARLLAPLQDDAVPLELDTAKVRKRRRKAAEAARLHELSQDPAQLAYGAAKARRRVNIGLMAALVLALGWSTAGVQTFAADGSPIWSPGWAFAWFVEPFMSLALLCFVGARAYFGTRGQPAKDVVLDRIEYFFLALTLGMNAFPYLPGVADKFSFPRLVLHLLGPVVAYAVVTGWPRLLARFATLDHGLPSRGATGRSFRGNASSESGVESGATDADDIEAKAARVRALIAAGDLPDGAGVEKIRRALQCATSTARAVRDRLAEGGGWNLDIDEEYR